MFSSALLGLGRGLGVGISRARTWGNGHIRTMASEADLKRVKARAEESERLLTELQTQLEAIKKAAVKQAGLGEEETLSRENQALRQEIESLKTALVLAEIGHGVRQVQLPTKGAVAEISASTPLTNGIISTTSAVQQSKEEPNNKKTKLPEQPEAGGKKPKGEKSTKGGDGKAKKAAVPAGGDGADKPVDISRLDMRVGKIVAVEKHPDADGLYVEQVDLGEGKNRTIVSGLVKHIPINAMRERIAVFMCNLKPAKMRGVMSEGMIMCAVGPEKTEILVPPTDSVIGDCIAVEDYPGTPDALLNPKKKIWESLKPDVRTNSERVATYKGSPLIIPGKGPVVAPTLADSQIS